MPTAAPIFFMFPSLSLILSLSESSLCLCGGAYAAELPGFVSLDGVSLTMLDLLKDLWGFARERKKFWLVPLIGTLLVLSVLIAIAEFSTVAPFIYTLF
jgi:hypothetical protein